MTYQRPGELTQALADLLTLYWTHSDTGIFTQTLVELPNTGEFIPALAHSSLRTGGPTQKMADSPRKWRTHPDTGGPTQKMADSPRHRRTNPENGGLTQTLGLTKPLDAAGPRHPRHQNPHREPVIPAQYHAVHLVGWFRSHRLHPQETEWRTVEMGSY